MIDQIKLQRARRDLAKAVRNDPTIRKNTNMVIQSMGTETKVRQSAFRKRMNERGYKQITVWVSDKALRKINDTMKKKGTTRNEAVELLINGK